MYSTLIMFGFYFNEPLTYCMVMCFSQLKDYNTNLYGEVHCMRCCCGYVVAKWLMQTVLSLLFFQVSNL
jgi:hypothetical protein